MVENNGLDRYINDLEKKGIEVPSELEGKLKQRITEVTIKDNRLKVLGKKALAASLIFLVTFSFLIKYSAGFAEFVAGLPLLHIAVEWFHGDAGTDHARDRGYYELDGVIVRENGYVLELTNIMFDEDRLVMSVIAGGEEIEKSSHNVFIEFKSLDFEEGPFSLVDFFVRGDDQLPVGRVEKIFQPGEVREFLSSNPRHLNINAAVVFENQGEEVRVEFNNIKIPFDRLRILKSDRYVVDKKVVFEKGVLTVEEVIVSPTRMRMDASLNMEEGFSITIPVRSILHDSQGNMYKPEGMGGFFSLIHNTITCFYVPSIYFTDMHEELYLSLELWFDSEKERNVKLSLDDSYPKSFPYMGEEIVIENVYHDQKLLYIKLFAPQNIMINHIEIDGIVNGSIGGFVNFAEVDTPRQYLFTFDIEYRPEYDIRLLNSGLLLRVEERIELKKGK